MASESPVESAAEPAEKVFLYIYTADWCGPCREDKPIWKAWAAENGLQVTDTTDGNYPVHVIDTDKVKSTRKIDSIPTYLILNQDGEELYRHEGRVDINELDTQWKRATQ
jgi:thiol-disulfide isomerase/thioredoxin